MLLGEVSGSDAVGACVKRFVQLGGHALVVLVVVAVVVLGDERVVAVVQPQVWVDAVVGAGGVAVAVDDDEAGLVEREVVIAL